MTPVKLLVGLFDQHMVTSPDCCNHIFKSQPPLSWLVSRCGTVRVSKESATTYGDLHAETCLVVGNSPTPIRFKLKLSDTEGVERTLYGRR